MANHNYSVYGADDKISVLKEFRVPDSLGIFYSMITQYLGFQRDSDEYKVMGLSAYGNSNAVKNYDFSWLLSLNIIIGTVVITLKY